MTNLPLRFLIPLVVVAVLSLCSILGFNGSLIGWSFLSAGALGALGSTAVVVGARRHRLLLGESVALSIVAFALLGPIAAGGLPTPSAAVSFIDGLVNGWSDLLSSVPPARTTAELRVLPYAIAWLSGLIGAELVRRDNAPVLPIVGPALGLVLTLLITVENRPIAAFVGVALGVGAIVLAVAGHDSTLGRSRSRSLAWSVGLLSVVAIAAPLVGPRLPFAEANDRFDLRQFQDRPWDPLDLPSPLVTIKASLKEEQLQEVMFVVRSDEPIERLATAVLGSYNGTVWTVADAQEDAPAEFVPVDQVFPVPDGVDPEDGIQYSIEIVGLDGPWIPVAGTPLEGSASSFRLNQTTGTLADPAGVQPGSVYELVSVERPVLSNSDRRELTALSNDADADLDLVPPQLRNLAGDVFEGIDAGTPRAIELSNRFVTTGFYDESDAARPGHSLARLEEFTADTDLLVGYEEQYAATAAVLARIGGLPSRVVVGYTIPADAWSDGQVAVTSEFIDAWIEIETEEFGWIPFDVTPDRGREPTPEALGITIKDVAIPNPPPPPPPPPDLRPPATPEAEEEEEEIDEEDDDSDSALGGATWSGVATVAGGSILIPLLLLSALGGLIVAWKRRRAKRRRRSGDVAERVAGAWLELVDRFAEAGVQSLDASTPVESAHAYLRDEPAAESARPALLALAERVDRAAFHPRPPGEEDVDQAWADCDHAVAELIATRSRRERLWMRTDPRPLLESDPTGRRRPKELEPTA